MASNGDSIFPFFFYDENVIISFVPLSPPVSMEKTKDRIWLESPEFSIDFIARQ